MSYRVLITPDFDRTFEILRSDFREIGVQLQAQSLDPKALAAAVQENDYRTYDLALTAVQAAPTDPDFTLSSFTCRTRGIFNLTGYCDEEYDRLYERQRSAASEEQRVDLVHQLQERIYGARPRLWCSTTPPRSMPGTAAGRVSSRPPTASSAV